MISHERLDRLVGQLLPQPIARTVVDVANRRTASHYDVVVGTTAFARREFDRIGADNAVRSRSVPTSPRSIPAATARWRGSGGRIPARSCSCTVGGCVAALAALRDSALDVRLVIVGEGPLRGRLQRQAARLPVDFTGFIADRATVADILASADVALAPGPHETFGLAALEALACGTRAVVSGTSALREILTPESGLSVDNDPEAVVAAAAIIGWPEEQRHPGARIRAETFAWPRAAAGMLTALGAA